MGQSSFLFISEHFSRKKLFWFYYKKFSSWVLSLFVTIEWTQTCVLYHPTNHSRSNEKNQSPKTENT